MTSFQANPEAQTAAAKKFQAEVEPINAAATKAEQLNANAAQAGTQYHAEGSAYHAALTTMIQTLLVPMAGKTEWVASTLTSTAANYSKQESANKSGLNSAGQGA